MILHTVNAAPTSPALGDCLRFVAPGDAILLLGDGVYAALADTAAYEGLQASGAELYILQTDARAAGILAQTSAIDPLDMDAFVALTERFPRQQAWY